MTEYYITVLLVLFFSSATERTKKDGRIAEGKEKAYWRCVFLTGMVLTLVAGLRYCVGTDYLAYMSGFGSRANRLLSDLKALDEPGLDLIAWICRAIYDDYALVFFACSLITVSLNVRTMARYSGSFFYAAMLYIFIGAWHGAFNGIRQYMAAAIVFAGHRFILEKKFPQYAAVVAVAFLFHRTALIMLPVYFLANTKISYRSLLIFIGVALVLRFSSGGIFAYMSSVKGHEQTQYAYMQTEVNIFRVLVALAPCIFVVLLNAEKLADRENTFYLNLLLINGAFMLSTSNSAYLARVGIFTDIYATIGFPKLVYSMYQQKIEGLSRFIKREDNRGYHQLMIAILVLYSIFWLYEVSSRDAYNHFQWIFSR